MLRFINYNLDVKVCASILSNNLLCEKTVSGTSCNSCHFKAVINDCSKWVAEMNGNFTNRVEQLSKLEKAELRFDDAVEIITEKQHKVILDRTLFLLILSSKFSQKTKNGQSWRIWQ